MNVISPPPKCCRPCSISHCCLRGNTAISMAPMEKRSSVKVGEAPQNYKHTYTPGCQGDTGGAGARREGWAMRVRSISHARVAVLLPHMPPPAGGCRADGGSSVDFLITGGGESNLALRTPFRETEVREHPPGAGTSVCLT